MTLLVVGSVALDTVETPRGRREEILGGAASYFSVAAALFTRPRLVAVVGGDFPERHADLLRSRGVDTAGLARAEGRTFRWGGRYAPDMVARETLFTELGVFERFDPTLPEPWRDAELVFLANIEPELQLRVLDQVRAPKLVACDTMNFWIHGRRADLLAVLRRVDLLVINEEEARDLSGETVLPRVLAALHALGPTRVVIKRADVGALLHDATRPGPAPASGLFFAPTLPVEDVVDPTGAGDSFAGGLLGAIARDGERGLARLRHAVLYGCALGSFSVEGFGLDRLSRLTLDEVEARVAAIRRLRALDEEIA